METFEELGLSPDLVEVLTTEGAEEPTPFQALAIPVVRRGGNVICAAGPGAGTLLAYGAPILDRLASAEEEERTGPPAIVFTSTGPSSERLALSLGRVAGALGLRTGSSHAAWVQPERSDVLFTTPARALATLREGRLRLASVRSVVIDRLAHILAIDGLDDLRTVMEFLPVECQKIVLVNPSRRPEGGDNEPEIRAFLEAHVPRAVHLPPRSVEADEGAPERGGVTYRIVEGPKEDAGLDVVADLLRRADARHVTVFTRTDDRAADVSDLLALHGYATGPVGDADAPVWIAADETAARPILDSVDAEVAVLSWDVPNGPDAMDRRHGGARGGTVLIRGRELGHLEQTARAAGYRLYASGQDATSPFKEELARALEGVTAALEEEDLGAYLLILEELFEEHDPAEVAAAAFALLRRRASRPAEAGSEAAAPLKEGTPTRRSGTPAGARGTPWVRLFVSLGRRDDAGPGDIVGAIAGECGIDGARIGRIDIRDTFSIVEIEEPYAERVIRGLNGKTVRGRAVRVDYDRATQERDGRPGRGTGPRSAPPGSAT